MVIFFKNKGFPGSSVGKESACHAGDPGSIPGSGRSPGEGYGKPLYYSCLENPMDRRAWWAAVHGLQRVGHDWATNTFKKSALKMSLMEVKQRIAVFD